MANDKSTEGKFTVINDEGKEVECEVLFTFESEETNKKYIVYTDNTLDEEGNTKVFASTYLSDADMTKLQPIETEKEWKIIEIILEQLQKQVADMDTEDKNDANAEKKIEALDEKQDSFADDREDVNEWISHVSEKIESVDEENYPSLFSYAEEIKRKIFSGTYIDKTDKLYELLKQIDSKLPFGSVIGSLGMEAYSKKNFEIAEKAFKDSDNKNNLAYIIRRGEVKDSAKYSTKYVAELLKDGVHEKEPFSMINMALLWALNVKGEDSWKLADNIMSMMPRDNVSSALDWWLDVARNGDVEGYLVHYWMLKHRKIDKTPLGSKAELLDRIVSEIRDMPDFMK